MKTVEKAKRTVIGIEISRDELAFRIGCKAMGVIPPRGMTAERALAEWNITTLPGVPLMGEGFRQAADAAVLFFHECVNAARQPS